MPRYERVEGASSKFWEIRLEGASFTTTYGRLGTAGRSVVKSFASEARARDEHDRLVAEKTKKGYTRVGDATTVPLAAVRAANGDAAGAPPETGTDADAEEEEEETLPGTPGTIARARGPITKPGERDES